MMLLVGAVVGQPEVTGRVELIALMILVCVRIARSSR
jgi:hypothetical protein